MTRTARGRRVLAKFPPNLQSPRRGLWDAHGMNRTFPPAMGHGSESRHSGGRGDMLQFWHTPPPAAATPEYSPAMGASFGG